MERRTNHTISKTIDFQYTGDVSFLEAIEEQKRAESGARFRVTDLVRTINDQPGPYFGQPITEIKGAWLVGGKEIVGRFGFQGYPNGSLRLRGGDVLVIRKRQLIFPDIFDEINVKTILTVRRSSGELQIATFSITEERAGDEHFWPSPLLPEVEVFPVESDGCLEEGLKQPPIDEHLVMPVRVRIAGDEASIANNETKSVGRFIVFVGNSRRALPGKRLLEGRTWGFGVVMVSEDLLGL